MHHCVQILRVSFMQIKLLMSRGHLVSQGAQAYGFSLTKMVSRNTYVSSAHHCSCVFTIIYVVIYFGCFEKGSLNTAQVGLRVFLPQLPLVLR